jgi:general secretion pathway protein A
MFTTHFKMTRQPFLERAPVEQILADERIAQGLARLEYLAKVGGSIGLVTGSTGVGKSSLLKLFVRSLSRNLYNPIYISLTHVGASGFLKLLVLGLGELPRRGKERLFLQILDRLHGSEHTTLLVIDDAHLLPSEALTDLRLLVSSGLEDGPALKVILSGQELLRDELRRARHADLLHRIAVRYHVPPLSREQTVSYIDFQMRTAGGSEKVFEPEAKTLIHDYASGVPRRINNIAIACLIQAATRNLQKISEALVNDTTPEFNLP